MLKYSLKDLLEYLESGSGDRVVINAGEFPVIISGDKKYRVGENEIKRKQFVKLLSDVIPDNMKEEDGSLKSGSFETESFYYKLKLSDSKAHCEIVRIQDAQKIAGKGVTEKTLNEYLERLVDMEGSDLHIKPESPPIIRIDGELKKMGGTSSLDASDTRQMLNPLLDERHRNELEEKLDTDFAYEMKDLARFRVNIYRDRKGLCGAFRFIPSEVVSADDINLPQAIRELCYLPKGLVLVTGPTGSGKSTTLCAMIDLVNRLRKDHIITVEDPVEFVHENKKCAISQREIGTHASSFARALRAALREDPDVVLVGEMRDLETIRVALETTETGHLVFATLHTTTASSTVERIVEQFPVDQQEQIRVMLANSLKAVISQTLLKRKKGGRVAAFEILLVTSAVSNLIRENKTYQIDSIIQTNRKIGMVTMNDSIIELVKDNTVSPEEAYSKSVDKSAIVEKMKKEDIDTSFLENIKKSVVE